MTPIGNAAARQAFIAAAEGEALHHAWLLSGPEGVGKGSFAREMAVRLLASAIDGRSRMGGKIADDHRVATLIAAGAHPDYRELVRLPKDPDKPDQDVARSIKIDQVRTLQPMFATKPALGLAMLERARGAGLPFAWIAGDSVYGGDRALRRWAEDHRIGYVLTVTSGQRLAMRPVAEWLADQVEARPEDAPSVWQRLSAGDGAKGPRLYDWACLPYRGAAPGFQCALLVRRSLADPDETTFYLTHAPTGTPLGDLVRIAGRRWTIESCFEQAKGEVGLDQYEVRSYPGWHRHVTLAMLAHAYLAVLRRTAIGGRGQHGPHPRPPAADRARDPAPAGRSRRPASARHRRGPALVHLATAPSAASKTRSLVPPDPNAQTTHQKA